MVRCIIYTDGEKTQESVLAPGEHTVGRSRSADIHLAQPDISGKHLKLEIRPDGAAAENLSSHGTLLNGEALSGKTELKEGDRLALGKHIGISFSFAAENAAAAPAPAADDYRPGAPAAGTLRNLLPRVQKKAVSFSGNRLEKHLKRVYILF